MYYSSRDIIELLRNGSHQELIDNVEEVLSCSTR